MAEHRGENFVGIARIDRERGDLLAINEAEMRPGFAGVGGFVDAIADRKIGTVQSLSAGYVDNVWVRGSNGDGADGLRRFPIKNGIPGATVVVRLPDSPVYLTDVEQVGLAGNAGGGAGASAAEGPNHAPVQFLVAVFGHLGPTDGCTRKKKY